MDLPLCPTEAAGLQHQVVPYPFLASVAAMLHVTCQAVMAAAIWQNGAKAHELQIASGGVLQQPFAEPGAASNS